MNESEIFNLAHQKVIFDHPSYRSSPAVGEDFLLSLQQKSIIDNISASPTALDSAVGEDLFFIGKLFIKQVLRLLPYHISFVEKFQQKYTVSQVVKKHPYLCTMN